MDFAGTTLKALFDIDPGFFVENVEDQCSELGLQGIHVWEGRALMDDAEGGSDTDYWSQVLREGIWREPTDAEWVALRARRSPFNSEAERLHSLVE